MSFTLASSVVASNVAATTTDGDSGSADSGSVLRPTGVNTWTVKESELRTRARLNIK